MPAIRRGLALTCLLATVSMCTAAPAAADERTELLKEAARLSYTNFCRLVPPPPDPKVMQQLAASPLAAALQPWLQWIETVAARRMEACRES